MWFFMIDCWESIPLFLMCRIAARAGVEKQPITTVTHRCPSLTRDNTKRAKEEENPENNKETIICLVFSGEYHSYQLLPSGPRLS